MVGVTDDAWGESVAAAVVFLHDSMLNDSSADTSILDRESLKAWASDRISHYKIPKQLLVVDALPRNVMGKITKPVVRELFYRLSRRAVFLHRKTTTKNVFERSAGNSPVNSHVLDYDFDSLRRSA